jgi:hypothetical protein
VNNIVIGSGITGSNVALYLLEKGQNVELWDVGKTEKLEFYDDENFLDSKKNFIHSFRSLVGDDDKNFINPYNQNLFDLPPLRNFVLNKDEINNEINKINNFEIFQSFNIGGLSNGWGANCIPYNDKDIDGWNLNYEDFTSSQKKIFKELTISNIKDHLNSEFNFLNLGTEIPIELDHRDNYLFDKFIKNFEYFKNENFQIGKARLAIKNSNTVDSCKLTSRCLWGCPQKAIYNPINSTLKKCFSYKKFKYLGDRKINYFRLKENLISEINYLKNNIELKEKINSRVFLCAGAIQSGMIFKKTCIKNNIEQDKFTTGLMDTKKIKIVYLLPKMIGKKINYKSIQFNRLIGGMNEFYNNRNEYIHLEFLHLNSLFYQPLINSIPLPLKLSKSIFYNFYSAMGVCTYFLPDNLNEKNKINYHNNNFEINYFESEEKKHLSNRIEKRIKKYLLKMSAIPIKTIKYNSGAAIHYAGTIPMGNNDAYPVNSKGEVKFIKNLVISDSSAFPNLPSKPVSANAASYGIYTAKYNI